MNNSAVSESSGPYRYWAFISYSHADEKYASWLHREIETYRGHARLVGSMNRAGEAVPKRLWPVFRDRDELAAATDLPNLLQESLLASKFLIVICSRASARSAWVNQEIRRFKALGRNDRILAVVVDGEPWASRSDSPANECFPQALRYQVETSGEEIECAEPLAADARATGDGKHNALVKIIAAMLGVRFDELRQRDAERRRRNRMIAASVLSVITLSLLGMLGYSVLQRRRAAVQTKVAESQKIVSRAIAAMREFRVDQAMLLAVAAYNVAPTFESRQLMWQLLGAEPTLKRYLASSGPAVTSIAFDPGGRYAATSTQAGSVTVWDLARGIPAGPPLQGNNEEIAYVCFAGGHSEQVAAVTVRNNLITWQQGKRSGVTPLSETELAAVHCATDPPELLGVDVNGRILAWDLARLDAAGNERGRLPVESVLFTRSGAQVAAVDDHSINIFDLKTGSTRSAEFTDSRLHITTSQISDDGSLVATVDSTSTLRVWKTETGKPANPLPLQLPRLVTSLQFSPNSKSLALALDDGSVQMVENNWMSFGARMRASGTDDKVLPVEFSPNGEVLLSGFMSGKVVEWHPTSSIQSSGKDEYSPCPDANAARVSMGGGLWLGSYCDDGTVVALSLSASPTRRVVTIGKDPVKEVKGFQLGADGKRGLLLYGNKVGLVDFPNASIAWITPGDPDDSFAGLFRDSQAAEAGALTTGGEMILWDMLRGSTHSVRSGVKDENWSPAALDASRGHVAAVSRRHVFLGTISGDRLAMRQLPSEVEDRGGFSFLNHGLDLVGLGLDGKVLKWHLSQGDAPPADAAPGVRARLVGYSPAEDLLLVVLDGTIHLVDPTSGRVLLESTADVREFSFSPDGTKLALTSGRYMVTVLDLDVNRWVRELCAVANRNMSVAEWESYIGTDVPYHRGCPNLPGGSTP